MPILLEPARPSSLLWVRVTVQKPPGGPQTPPVPPWGMSAGLTPPPAVTRLGSQDSSAWGTLWRCERPLESGSLGLPSDNRSGVYRQLLRSKAPLPGFPECVLGT